MSAAAMKHESQRVELNPAYVWGQHNTNFGSQWGTWKEKNKQGNTQWKVHDIQNTQMWGEMVEPEQQQNYEVKTLTPSRGLQTLSYTYKCGMVKPCEMIHEPWESTAGSVVDSTTHLTGHESTRYCVSNWPLLSCLWIYCIDDSNRQQFV